MKQRATPLVTLLAARVEPMVRIGMATPARPAEKRGPPLPAATTAARRRGLPC